MPCGQDTSNSHEGDELVASTMGLLQCLVESPAASVCVLADAEQLPGLCKCIISHLQLSVSDLVVVADDPLQVY